MLLSPGDRFGRYETLMAFGDQDRTGHMVMEVL